MNISYLRFIAACLLFGSNGIVASHIDLGSGEIVYLRTFIGSVFLIALFLLTGGRFTVRTKGRHFFFLVLSGVAMGTSWMFLYEAYRQTGVGIATLAYYCGPVLVMALAPLIFRERLAAARVLALIAAMIGMVMVNGGDVLREGLSFGLVCGLMSAVMLAAMVVFNKMAESITGFENAVIQLTVSFLTVAVFVALRQGVYVPVPPGSLLPVILLGLVNTGLGCYLYFSSMQRLPAQSVAIIGYLEPLSALVLAALVLGERLEAVQIAGALLILGGAAWGEYFGQKAGR